MRLISDLRIYIYYSEYFYLQNMDIYKMNLSTYMDVLQYRYIIYCLLLANLFDQKNVYLLDDDVS